MTSICKIYLAGPDVFYPDVLDIARRKKEIIHRLSNGQCIGIHPFDKEVDGLDIADPMERGRIISRTNRDLMNESNLILANITPFRGANVDDGTAFEIGYMMAQGKSVYAYSNSGHDCYIQNVEDWQKRQEKDAVFETDSNDYIRDMNGATIEQFGFPCNLMMGEIIEGRFAVTDKAVAPTDLTAFEQVVKIIVEQQD